MRIIIGLLSLVGGIVIWGVAISALVSWLVFCFGSVIIGIFLLIFAPYALLAPLVIATPGTALFVFGMDCIANKKDDSIYNQGGRGKDLLEVECKSVAPYSPCIVDLITIPSITSVDITSPATKELCTNSEFADKLAAFDWYYDLSDSYQVRSNGDTYEAMLENEAMGNPIKHRMYQEMCKTRDDVLSKAAVKVTPEINKNNSVRS